MTGGDLIREARLLAELSQRELAERIGVPRPSIARWEAGQVEPGFETVLRLLRACGYDLEIVRYQPDATVDERLGERLELTPQERLRLMLGIPDTSG